MHHSSGTTKAYNALVLGREWSAHGDVAELFLFHIHNLDTQMFQAGEAPVLAFLEADGRSSDEAGLLKEDTIILQGHGVHKSWGTFGALFRVRSLGKVIGPIIEQCHGLLIIRANPTLIGRIGCFIDSYKGAVGNLKSGRFGLGPAVLENQIGFMASTVLIIFILERSN